MFNKIFNRLAFMATFIAASVGMSATTIAGGHQVVDSIHFLIPGGAGGGWDGTARGITEALTNSGPCWQRILRKYVWWWRWKGYRLPNENADSNHGTLMVNSTPIVLRSLAGVFPHNFRDLTLVSGTIGDYAAMVVPSNSDIKSMSDLVSAYNSNPSNVAIGGGSVPGGMDHLVAAMVMRCWCRSNRG